MLVKIEKTKKIKLIYTFFVTLFIGATYSQVNVNSLIKDYEKFGITTKEVVYVHINKSVFVENEMLGFSTYVLDKSKKSYLPITNNLYCTITNENGDLIKSKLIHIKNGTAANTFKIDSLFSSGIYKFRAYTNWMLNFNERNYFEQPFYVYNAKVKKVTKPEIVSKNYTIQVLPEGGHIVNNIKNTIGIVVKDKNGFGLKFANGKIIDQNNTIISEFKLNKFGIAKTFLIPDDNRKYSIVVDKEQKQLIHKINNIKDFGIGLSIKKRRGDIGLILQTNSNTHQTIRNKSYVLAIHNGTDLKTSVFNFQDKKEVAKIIKNKDLFSGINIFTIFDVEKNQPILERLYFNFDGISKVHLADVKTTIKKDSTLFNLKLDAAVNTQKLQNLSISILPYKTESYNFNSNILSQTYLEPYVKGFIEEAYYYFSNSNTTAASDLDLLLITQGWSAYDWGTILEPQNYRFKFEQGINVVANTNKKKDNVFLVYPLKNSKSQIFSLTKNEKAFTHTNLFPEDDELYAVSALGKGAGKKKASLYLQYFPSAYPKFTFKNYTINYIDFKLDKGTNNVDFPLKNELNSEKLSEIVITTNVDAQRIQKIKNRTFGTVDFFNDQNSGKGQTLALYLSSKGWYANDFTGELIIINPRPNSPNNNIPLVILDDVQLTNFGFLANFQLDIVDYIEVNKSGAGYGIRGGGGVIKIKTDPIKRLKKDNDFTKISSYKFPLTFSKTKKYYTPVYPNYDSKFFKKYGVISWLPNLKINKNQELMFKISNDYNGPVTLYVEGLVDGKFISEPKTVNLSR